MKVSIMQPAYLPWLGYFDRIHNSDLHIILDDVELDKNSKTKFTNRNKIRQKEGWSWLTIPLLTKGTENKIINQLHCSKDENWQKKHLASIRLNYAKSPFFTGFFPAVEQVYSTHHEKLVDVIYPLNNILFRELDITTPVRYSSEMNTQTKKDDLILELCIKAGATTYISGPFGRDYLDENKFGTHNIKVVYHDYQHPEYKQLHSGFEPYMSVIDLLFNHGKDSLGILNSRFVA